MRADEEIDKIVQRTIDLRARLEPAEATLEDLHTLRAAADAIDAVFDEEDDA